MFNCSQKNERKAWFFPPEFSVVIELANGELFGSRRWNVFDPSSSKINQNFDNKPRLLHVSLPLFQVLFGGFLGFLTDSGCTRTEAGEGDEASEGFLKAPKTPCGLYEPGRARGALPVCVNVCTSDWQKQGGKRWWSLRATNSRYIPRLRDARDFWEDLVAPGSLGGKPQQQDVTLEHRWRTGQVPVRSCRYLTSRTSCSALCLVTLSVAGLSARHWPVCVTHLCVEAFKTSCGVCSHQIYLVNINLC